MKEYTTDHLTPQDRRNLSGNLLSSIGNDNIRGAHIYYFEKNIFEYKENQNRDLSSSPNYYAWLILYSEHIFWHMRAFCFKQSDLKEDNLELVYNELITKFCDICRDLGYSKEEIKDIYDKIVKVLIIRHAMVHNGFPNLFPKSLKEDKIRNQPSITEKEKKIKFSRNDMIKIIKWYSNPTNFIVAKSEFDFLISIMEKGPSISVIF